MSLPHFSLASPVISIPPAIAESMCRQLSTFQHHIESRSDDAGCPTMREITMQTRLIGNIVRIAKHNATDYVAKGMDAFIRHLRRSDKQLAAVFAEKFMEFIDPGTAEAGGPPPASNERPLAAAGPAALPITALLNDPPLTEDDFEAYAARLQEYKHGNEHTTMAFRGRQVNKHWLEYNLVQYTLPAAQRLFITDQQQYISNLCSVDRLSVIKAIEDYLHS